MWGNYAKMLNNRNRKRVLRIKARTMGGGSRIYMQDTEGGRFPSPYQRVRPACTVIFRELL